MTPTINIHKYRKAMWCIGLRCGFTVHIAREIDATTMDAATFITLIGRLNGSEYGKYIFKFTASICESDKMVVNSCC